MGYNISSEKINGVVKNAYSVLLSQMKKYIYYVNPRGTYFFVPWDFDNFINSPGKLFYGIFKKDMVQL